MRFFTTIPGLTVPRIRAEIIACLVDLPNCDPYSTSDWYAVRLQGGDETDVSGDDLGPIVVMDDEDVVTESYFAVVSPRGRYRYVCNGQEMRSPPSLYDSLADVRRYGRVYPGDTVEPVVFTARYWVKRRPS